MRIRIQHVCAFVLIVVMLGVVSGCASAGANGSYSLKQTRDNVDWAMLRFQNRATFGFITPSEHQQVSSAYTTYQTAFNDAARQAHLNYSAPTPNNVKQLADQLLDVLAAIP